MSRGLKGHWTRRASVVVVVVVVDDKGRGSTHFTCKECRWRFNTLCTVRRALARAKRGPQPGSTIQRERRSPGCPRVSKILTLWSRSIAWYNAEDTKAWLLGYNTPPFLASPITINRDFWFYFCFVITFETIVRTRHSLIYYRFSHWWQRNLVIDNFCKKKNKKKKKEIRKAGKIIVSTLLFNDFLDSTDFWNIIMK